MAERTQWEQARSLYPSTEYASREWSAYFDDHPDVLTKLLGDVYRVYKTEEQKRAGKANPAGGRRKSYIDGNLDELWSILTPKLSMEPFPEAFRHLQGEMSLRAFAGKCGLDHRELSRLLRGSTKLTPFVLEEIAKAADVHPAYFREWRTQVVLMVLGDVFDARPHLSVLALKHLGRR